MKNDHFGPIFALILLVGGCASEQEHKPTRVVTSGTAILKTTLRALNTEDPAADLRTNIGNGDYRFIDIYGFVCYPPGVTEQELPLVSKYGMRALDGTSDAIESDEHAALMRKAVKYAETYNELLVHEVSQHR
jgi:hypothetical protein